MNAKQLKRSILNYAVCGKLTNQLNNDGTAEEFIKKINEEKERLLSLGKLRKVPSEKYKKSEEFKFPIPENWSWSTVGEVTFNRDSERIPLSKTDRAKQKNPSYNYYGASGVIDKVDDYLFDKPLLLIGEDGANLLSRSSPIAFIARGKYWVNNHAHVLDGINETFLEYVAIYINSISLSDFVTGTAQPKMNQRKLNSIPIPIPPYSEQERILDKVNELMEKVLQYDEVNKHEIELNAKFPTQLEKSVLQYAMQGKLVEQVDTDEPARLLVERIKAMKERLVKEKVIKKEKALPEITEYEIPFEVPSSWEWVRLGDVVTLISGRDLTPKEYGTDSSDVPYITGASNFNNGELEIVRWTPVPKVVTVAGDLLITCKGTIGEMAIQNIKEAHIARQVMAIRLHRLLNTKYVQIYLNSVLQEIKNSAKSMIPGISREDLLNRIIPIPPSEEQVRIVERFEEMMNSIKKL